jgi:hypothetical protein
MFMLFFLWQPINTVIIPDHNNPYIKMGANALIIIGSYMNIQATYDLIDDDLFGYIQQSWFKKEGQDLPTPFVLKRLSRLSLSMRHPLYSGSLVKLFAVLLHGEVTIGRALYILQFIICTSLGSYFEER